MSEAYRLYLFVYFYNNRRILRNFTMIGSIILIIVFTFLNAIFASAEIAVISMNETKLKCLVDDGNKRAKNWPCLPNSLPGSWLPFR